MKKNDNLMKKNIKVQFTEDAENFINSLDSQARKKIYYNIQKVSVGNIDNELFKKVTNTIWEFRTLYNGMCYRLLSFWDTTTDTIIVAAHGFKKKTQKTPEKEIAKAEAIRKKYFNLKNKLK